MGTVGPEEGQEVATMLDAFIIEELRRKEREEERKRDDAMPRLEIPLAPDLSPEPVDDEEPTRRVIIIDFSV